MATQSYRVDVKNAKGSHSEKRNIIGAPPDMTAEEAVKYARELWATQYPHEQYGKIEALNYQAKPAAAVFQGDINKP